MTAMPLLRRENTRTLCNQFTTIFDHTDAPPPSSHSASSLHSSSPSRLVAHSVWSLSVDAEPAAQGVKYLCPSSLPALSADAPSQDTPRTQSVPAHWSLHQESDDHRFSTAAAGWLQDALASPASTELTPASTPGSESDDSALLDTLSPPSSPWFPSSLDLETGSIKNLHPTFDSALEVNSDGIHDGSDLDFFNNSFYQILPNVCYSPHLYHPGQRASPVTSVVRSRKANRSTMEVSRTAAPSDLFNVAIDEVLSEPLLNFESEAETETEVHLQTSNFDMMPMASEQVSNSQTSISSESTVTEEEGDSSDEFMGDEEVKPAKPRRRSSNLKAQSVKRHAAERTPKVYPSRKPKALTIQPEEEDQNSDNSATVSGHLQSSSSSSSHLGTKKISTRMAKANKDGFKCELCPHERFGRVHDLKRHQVSKHNEKTWPCDYCRRPFVRRDALLRHYAVKASRQDGIHPTTQEANRLSEARARARLY